MPRGIVTGHDTASLQPDIHLEKKHFILLNIVTFDVVQVSVINSTIVIITIHYGH